MAVLYSNNASTTLSASITNSATSLTVAAGKGALFPAISGSDYFYITLVSASGVIEIMKVTARSADVFTVTRGQDGTTAVAWAAGDRVELRFNKALLDDVKAALVSAVTSADWNVANPNVAQLISTSTNGVNGVTNYVGMHFPHASLNYGFQIAGRNDSAYYRTLENNTYTAWRAIAHSATQLYTFPVLDNNLNLDSGQQDKVWATNIGTATDRGTKPTNYAFVVNLGGRAASGLQIAASYGGSDNFYVRRGSDNGGSVNGANAWQPWYTLLHSGNYSSYAAAASHTHSYLPLSGGALTGNLTVDNALTTMRNNTASGASLVAYVLNNGGSTSSYMYIGSNPGIDWRVGKDVTGANTSNFQIANHTGTIYFDLSNGALNLPNNSGFSVNGNTVLHAGNYTNYKSSDSDKLDGYDAYAFSATGSLSCSGDFQYGSISLSSNSFSLSSATTDADNHGRFYFYGTSGQIISRYMPIDKAGLYRMKIRWKASEANATYIAVFLLDTNGNNISAAGTYWAYPWSGGGAPTAWQTNEWWYDGSSFPSNAAYVAFGISHTNYSGGNATYYVSQLEMERVNKQISGNTVLHAGNFSSYALPNPGSGTGGRVLVNLSGNPSWSDASFTYDPIMGQFRATNFRANVGDAAPTWNFNAILHAGNYTGFSGHLRAGGGNDGMDFNTLAYNTMYYAYISDSPNRPGNRGYSYGTILTFDPGQGAGGRAQFYVSHAGNDLIFRGGWGGNDSWQAWNRVLTDQNYTSYGDGRYVLKTGDTMTGHLTMTGGASVRVFFDGSSSITSQLYFANNNNNRAWNWQLDENNNAALWGFNGSTWAKKITATQDGYLLAGGKYQADGWVHSDRDFVDGTLIQTDIAYNVTNGDPFVLEIRGNSYGYQVPFDIQYQGYIYADTIINHGGYSNGTNITGLVAINYNGNLCFWFPRQAYWQGFYVRAYSAYATYPRQRVFSISNSAKPTTAKQVDLSSNIRQSLHSGNYSSYSLPLSGGTLTGQTIFNSGAVFFNDGSSRAMYLKGSGNIIQFCDADGTFRWENVGRNGTYYIYKGYGTGSGYKFQIDDSGNITINNGNETTVSGALTVSGASYSTINKPSPGGYQTTLLVGSTSDGLFLTSNSAIIGKGAYYNNGWIATAAAGSAINFTGSTPTIFYHSGATVGSGVSMSAEYAILHAGNYNNYSPTLSGGGAVGTWPIRITGYAAQGSQRLYSIDGSYNYDSANPYFGYLTYNGPANRWRFKVSPATPDAVEVSYADSAGSASSATTASKVSGTSGYAHAGTGMYPFYNWGGANGGASAPSDGSYTIGISVGSHPSDQAYGFQIARNMWNTGLWTRGYDSGWGGWVRLLDSSNYTDYGDGRYVRKTGDTMSGALDFSNSNTRRTISKDIGYRGVWDGTLNGYLLFAKAYVSGNQANSEVSGRIFLSRGGTGSGRRTETFEVFSKSAYQNENFVIHWIGGRDFSAGTLHKVTYNGTVYHALRLGQTGGGPDGGFIFDGFTTNAGLIVALDSEVSNVTSYGSVGFFAGTDGTFSVGGNTVLSAGNYTDYVPISTDGGANKVLKTASNGYLYLNNWMHVGGGGLFSSNNSAHWYPADGSYGAWKMSGSRNGWSGIAFGGLSNGEVTLMISPNSNETGFYNPSYGWQILWTGGTLYNYKNSYGGGTQAVVLDSSNYSSYAIPLSGGVITGNTSLQGASGISLDFYNTTTPSTTSVQNRWLGGSSFIGKNSSGTYHTLGNRFAREISYTNGATFGAVVDEAYVSNVLNIYTQLYQDSWGIYSSYATGSLARHFAVLGGSIGPGSSSYDNTMSAGTSLARYTIVYATTGTINTSDVREKEQIQDLDAAELRVAMAIKGLIKRFKWKEAVVKKGADARIHVGVIAQEVEQAFIAEGLNPAQYALFCEDVWWEKMVPNQNYGRPECPNEPQTILETFETEVEGGVRKERKGIRYDQLLAFVIAAI